MLTVKVPDRILIVDGDPAVREALETHLNHRGFEALTAGAGQEAIGILGRQKIACMLADSRLFGTPAGELLARAMERDPNLAILVTSSTPDINEAVHLDPATCPAPCLFLVSRFRPDPAIFSLAGGEPS